MHEGVDTPVSLEVPLQVIEDDRHPLLREIPRKEPDRILHRVVGELRFTLSSHGVIDDDVPQVGVDLFEEHPLADIHVRLDDPVQDIKDLVLLDDGIREPLDQPVAVEDLAGGGRHGRSVHTRVRKVPPRQGIPIRWGIFPDTGQDPAG
ncbi:MAG: hypothetical protein A4E42_00037 [Methanoregulaceae archaeon PtaU1.Bin222]|nr:MAG: hypothetical protein A4E42_00037 [Methanoregulaceae archaeon PtaU1.Bin222]